MAQVTVNSAYAFENFSFPLTWARSIAERFARHRRYRQTLDELSSLSNHDLADLGLHRSALRRVAWQAAYDA